MKQNGTKLLVSLFLAKLLINCPSKKEGIDIKRPN